MARASVLIVDDEEDFARLLGDKLAECGYRTRVVTDPKLAFNVAKKERPHVVILDVMMPRLGGFEICRRIRRDPVLYLTPVIMLTAMAGEEELVHGLKQGADDYIPKPFAFAALEESIRAVLKVYSRRGSLDLLTGLLDTRTIRNEITYRLGRDERFALAGIDILHLNEFLDKYGKEKRDELICMSGRVLAETRAEYDLHESGIGHTGGGRFLCILHPEVVKRYFLRVRERFLTAAAGPYGQPLPTSMGGLPLDHGCEAPLDLTVSVLTNLHKKYLTAHEMLDRLSQLRRKGEKVAAGGIYADSRA